MPGVSFTSAFVPRTKSICRSSPSRFEEMNLTFVKTLFDFQNPSFLSTRNFWCCKIDAIAIKLSSLFLLYPYIWASLKYNLWILCHELLLEWYSNPRYIPYNPQLGIWSTTSVLDGIILYISGPTVVAPKLSHLPTPDIGDDAAYLYTLHLHILPPAR